MLRLPYLHRTFVFLLLSCLSCCLAIAQTTYTARIVDAETGEPLPLVNIYLSEHQSTLTNFDGEFSLEAQPEDLLRITCIGRQSIALHAGELPAVLRMQMLSSTLSEVTVHDVEGTILEIARRVEKAYGRKKYKEAQYFYRQTSVLAQKQDIVEAFIGAKAAVNLRDMEFLSGRHGRLSEAAWSRSSINEMNMHHVLEVGPMTKDVLFWHDLVTPLPNQSSELQRMRIRGNALVMGSGHKSRNGIEYLQTYYDITIEDMDGDGQQLYRIQLRRREDTEIKAPIMTGTLYVDRPTLSVLAFDGRIENVSIRFGKGNLRSATTVPVTLDFHIDYRYDRKFPEVADLSMQAQWGDFQTRTLLFNVNGQKRLKNKKGTHARENMLVSIDKAGYDSTFWANNEVVKRTAEEAAIAAGTVERQQARLDSAATAQAALPPLERLADRLKRFGKAIPQEKVFIHMDNTSYFLGDTIWFAAYTRRTNNDTPSRISRVLYAELWNHDGYLVERKLVEMQDGRGRGFFTLPDTLYSGYFELRAYTRWQLNWGQTEHFHNWQSEYWFYNKAMAKDFFRDYEKLYSRVFPVYDKPKQPGDFYRDMTLRPLRRYFKSEPKPAELRLSLFPEGGNLVAGVPCRVAFEAATSEGEVKDGTVFLRMKREKGKGEKGMMKNDKGEVVDSVETENRGRGTFVFTPEEGRKYEVVFRAEKTVVQEINDVKADGVSLQVNLDSLTGQWTFNVHATGKASRQPLGLTVMHEGKMLMFEEVQKPQILFMPSPAHLGIHQVTVFDSIGHVYADRLFFVTRPDLSQPTLQFTGLKEHYQPYEPVDLDVTSAHLMPGQTISVAVRDTAHSDHTFDSGNVMTEMLLASEIKGFVPQPEYFFEADDDEHRRALDLLMMTQGWRRFNWQDMAVKGAWELTHPAEHTQMVTGTVNRYYANLDSFDPVYDRVLAEHERFMRQFDTPLSEQDSYRYSDPYNFGSSNSGYYAHSYYNNPSYGWDHSVGNRSYGWNLRKDNPRNKMPEYFSEESTPAPFQPIRQEWRNDDYNVLNFRTADSYRERRRNKMTQTARQYLEEGSVKKEVRVHAEFVNTANAEDFITGDIETRKGRFQIDLPRFTGQCIFFLGASDTTKWNKKEPHAWVKVDPTDEYSHNPTFPEYYIRLNLPYPRWVKPYTYYQVHNATSVPPAFSSQVPSSQEAKATAKRQLLTDGNNLLQEVTIRARHGGLRRIDYSKPAYVLDAYQALNLSMDAGLIDYTFSAHEVATKAAMSLIGDMGMERRYNIDTSEGQQPGLYRGPLEQRRWNLLPYIDKMYIYTDYSPRREGDERYEQSNQPSVRIDLRRFPDDGQRVTYIDRRYILNGFAQQADFYNPDYQRTPPTSQTCDYRRTLYWNPDFKLDANGRGHIRFFNNSRHTSLDIDAAGQTTQGGLLYNQ